MKAHLAAILSGMLFGLGLGLSGMTMPSKVIAFLDVAGAWDPSLALVMGGAVGVHLVLSRVVRRRQAPLFDASFHLPTRRNIDGRLVAGAAVFGAGWGLGGYCPGPALVSAAAGAWAALAFVAAMTAGMVLQHVTRGTAATIE